MNQREIASAIGVSQTTVSLVLKDPNTEKVSQKRRKQIMDFIQKVQYTYRPPNGKTGTICYMFAHARNSEYKLFYDRFLDSIESETNKRNYGVLIRKFTANDNFVLTAGKFDGIIFEGTPAPEELKKLSRHKLVLLNSSYNDPHPLCDSVEPNDSDGMEMAMRHLLEKGHRRIAYLAPSPVNTHRAAFGHYHPRLNAFLNSCRLHDIEIKDDYVIQPKCEYGAAATERCIEQVLKNLLALPERPTALICFNDMYAMFCIRQATKHGLQLPHDLSIIGTDNSPEGIMSFPALTSIDHNPAEMCRLAIEALFRRIQEPERPFCRINSPTTLIERESVARI